jgi:hypothetical protein
LSPIKQDYEVVNKVTFKPPNNNSMQSTSETDRDSERTTPLNHKAFLTDVLLSSDRKRNEEVKNFGDNSENSKMSQSKRNFIAAPVKTIQASAKARFIIRPDALKVKKHENILPPLE